MYVNDSVSGNEVQISSVPRNYYWSPEDNFFYSTSSFGSYLGLGSPLDEPIKIVTATPQHITWSKDESKLAVVAEDNHTIYSTTTGEIIISFDITPESAGNDRYITSFTSFSPDGLYLVYGASSGSTQKLYMMEVATGVHKLVASSEYTAFDEVYAWSLSSKYIAIGESNPENTHALNIYHVSSGILEPITDSSVKAMGFEWSPAEDKLAYRVTEQDSFFGKIYIRNVSLPNESAEVSSHEKVSGFSWSPDSRYLAYYSQMNDSSYSLSLVDSENNSYTTLNDLGPNFNPARELWSASSKYILYSTADETTTNLFVIRSDEAEKIPLDQYTLGTDNHQIKDFRWVPESDTIFYSKRIDKSTSDTESIHTLEIDSFISTSVSNDHSVSFAEKVWLFP